MNTTPKASPISVPTRSRRSEAIISGSEANAGMFKRYEI
jgi:hypothetical protein